MQAETQHTFSFSGSGSEYFKIWIVNLLLTIVTLGIYSAWATVRKKRYFYGNTWVLDHDFEYHGQPVQILIGRLIAVGAFVLISFLERIYPYASIATSLLIIVIAPWVILKYLQFNARMSSYRHVRFSFTGSFGKIFLYFLLLQSVSIVMAIALISYTYGLLEHIAGPIILTLLSIVVLLYVLPYAHYRFTEHYINHLHYGEGDFNAQLAAKKYRGIYHTYYTIIMVIAMLVWALVTALNSTALSNSLDVSYFIYVSVMILALFYLILFFSQAYFFSNPRNYYFSATHLDQVVRLNSTLSTRTLVWLYFSNALLIILTLGFGMPWAKVRITKYIANNTELFVNGDIKPYVNQDIKDQSALGDQMAEVFDIDIGL